MRLLKLVIVVPFTAFALAACGSSVTNNSVPANSGNMGAATATTPAANIAPASAGVDGKQLFIENCQICHRDTGKGGPVTVQGKKLKPADLTSDRQKKHPDDDIAKDISEGSPDDGMPSFKAKLKPEEIKAVVGYIRTLQQQ